MSRSGEEPLFDRIGGVYGIPGSVDDPVERLYETDTADQNPAMKEFHVTYGKRRRPGRLSRP